MQEDSLCAPLSETPLTSLPSSGNVSSQPPPNNAPSSSPKQPARPHRVVTRSQNNIFKPKKIYTATKHPIPENLEPSNVREAMRFSHWRQAMDEEFDALLRNGTWSLVPRSKTQNVVGCKWLFRIKRNSDGSISRYKAR